MSPELIELARWCVSLVVPAASGLGGVLVGARLTGRREAEKRRYDFIAQQLREFYAPLLGIRMEIQARSELRVRISGTADAVWRKLCEDSREISVEALQKLNRDRGPQFGAIIDHDNRQLHEALLPAYRKMVEIFRDKIWLAEHDTRVSFQTLIEFIDIWDRFIAKTLPGEVIAELDHSEAKLHAFYVNLQTTHDELRRILAAG